MKPERAREIELELSKAEVLARLAVQSDLYQTDEEFRIAVDDVLGQERRVRENSLRVRTQQKSLRRKNAWKRIICCHSCAKRLGVEAWIKHSEVSIMGKMGRQSPCFICGEESGGNEILIGPIAPLQKALQAVVDALHQARAALDEARTIAG